MQVFGSGTTRRGMVPEGAGGAVVAVAEAGARKQKVKRWANRAQEPGVVGERADGTQMEVVGAVRVGSGRQAGIAVECQWSIVQSCPNQHFCACGIWRSPILKNRSA